MGEVPWWYPPIQRAQYLNCSPWEIDDTCSRYLWGLIASHAMQAERAAALARKAGS